MLTEFGKALRIIRIEKEQLLKDMANILMVTPSYLSAVETGKRNIPEAWINIIIDEYNLSSEKINALREASVKSQRSATFIFDDIKPNIREIVLSLARREQDIDTDTYNKINNLLECSDEMNKDSSLNTNIEVKDKSA